MLASRSGSILGRIHRQGTSYSKMLSRISADPLAGCSDRILGGIHWQATLVGYYSGTLSGTLAGIWLGALVGYSAGSTGELAGSSGELLWDTERDTRRDPLAILGGTHSRAALTGYSAGPLACSGGILGGSSGGIWAGSTLGYGILGGIHKAVYEDPRTCFGSIAQTLQQAQSRDPSISREEVKAFLDGLRGFTGEQLRRVLGGIHWRAALVAGSTGDRTSSQCEA